MLKFLRNCKELLILLTQVSIKRQSNIYLIDLPQYILTINPKILLINSSIEQAQQISDLEGLYGDKWSNIYKELAAKKRLEDNFKSGFSRNNVTSSPPSKCTCNDVSSTQTKDLNNVCS
jgi:hypothetical protein